MKRTVNINIKNNLSVTKNYDYLEEIRKYSRGLKSTRILSEFTTHILISFFQKTKFLLLSILQVSRKFVFLSFFLSCHSLFAAPVNVTLFNIKIRILVFHLIWSLLLVTLAQLINLSAKRQNRNVLVTFWTKCKSHTHAMS